METRSIGKEVKLDLNGSLCISCGVTRQDKPNVFYVCAKGWIAPTNEDKESEELKKLMTSIKLQAKRDLLKCGEVLDKCIAEVTYNTDNVLKGKKKFFMVEVYLQQKGNLPIERVSEQIRPFAKEMGENVMERLNGAEFEVSRKKS